MVLIFIIILIFQFPPFFSKIEKDSKNKGTYYDNKIQ